jgi:endoglucanase
MIGLQRSLLRSRWRAGLLVSAVAALIAGAGVATASSAEAAAGCRVGYTNAGQWPGGFTANVTVTNLGDRIDGWRLGWTFPSGQTVSQAWNATVTASGAQVTATDAGHGAEGPDRHVRPDLEHLRGPRHPGDHR